MNQTIVVKSFVNPQPVYEGDGVFTVPQLVNEAEPYSGLYIDIELMIMEMEEQLPNPLGQRNKLIERDGLMWCIRDWCIEWPARADGEWYWFTTLEAIILPNGKQMTPDNPFFIAKEKTA
jgi:hypothetical protein